MATRRASVAHGKQFSQFFGIGGFAEQVLIHEHQLVADHRALRKSGMFKLARPRDKLRRDVARRKLECHS
jgi:hypothetical protein